MLGVSQVCLVPSVHNLTRMVELLATISTPDLLGWVPYPYPLFPASLGPCSISSLGPTQKAMHPLPFSQPPMREETVRGPVPRGLPDSTPLASREGISYQARHSCHPPFPRQPGNHCLSSYASHCLCCLHAGWSQPGIWGQAAPCILSAHASSFWNLVLSPSLGQGPLPMASVRPLLILTKPIHSHHCF